MDKKEPSPRQPKQDSPCNLRQLSPAKLQSLLLEGKRIAKAQPGLLEIHEKKRKGTYFA